MSNQQQQQTLLVLDNLTVQRGDLPLCEGVSLSLNSGDICHLIGANGTGKTTLMMQLAGLLPLDTGSVIYQGRVGLPDAPLYVSHQLGIHPNLSVAQNLTFLLNLYGLSPTSQEIADALTWAGLDGFEQLSSHQLSAGQTRRITLARLYLLTPYHTCLWLLDEPFTALDVQMVQRLEARLQQFVAVGGAVLMTSHQSVAVATKQLDLSDFLPKYTDNKPYDAYDYDEPEVDIDAHLNTPSNLNPNTNVSLNASLSPNANPQLNPQSNPQSNLKLDGTTGINTNEHLQTVTMKVSL